MSTIAATIALTFTVPVVCTVKDNAPICNLELTKVNYNEWVDSIRGYKITVDNGILTIEAIE